MKNLSRNTPIAFVVGAAGFLGSNLVEKLLEKRIQVVGVDNLSTGVIENLIEASKNKDFYFLNQSVHQKIPLDFPRLDYAFFIINGDQSKSLYLKNFNTFLDICGQFKPKIVLASSVSLYESKNVGLEGVREAERLLAKFTPKVNARVVRLAAVYGPRMHFREDDPIMSLINAAVLGKIQQETAPLDFTTRAVYVDDAVSLLIKAVMHGATAQKIYDGVLPVPVKVTEVKQLLLDPVWYEEKGFLPTELPPWPTPNLNKTMKELSWKPAASIITALKATLSYFSGHPGAELKSFKSEDKVVDGQETSLAPFAPDQNEIKSKTPVKKREWGKTLSRVGNWVKIGLGAGVISAALVYPVIDGGVSAVRLSQNWRQAEDNLAKGDFNKAGFFVEAAKSDVRSMKDLIKTFELFKAFGPFAGVFADAEKIIETMEDMTDVMDHLTKGGSKLGEAFRIISGESEGDTKRLLEEQAVELDLADRKLGGVQSLIGTDSFGSRLPGRLRSGLAGLEKHGILVQSKLSFVRLISSALPQVIASDGTRSYLVILQDETRLRPGGGMPVAFAEVTFKEGKLLGIKVDSIEALDRQLKEKIIPPSEVVKDFGPANWSLKNSNFEPDFPANAKLMKWFYAKEGGKPVSGIVVMDLNALARLTEETGPYEVKTSDQTKDTIRHDNLLSKVMVSSDEDPLLKEVFREFINRLFFLPKTNPAKLLTDIQELLSEKHVMVYFSDPVLFSKAKSEGFAGVVPRQTQENRGERGIFLALSEANLEGNHVNYYLKREINIETRIDNSDYVTNRVKVTYLNQSPSEIWPGGEYRFRLKFYLAAGSKVTAASWGGKDILPELTAISDFGRAGYSGLLELKTKERNELILEWETGKQFEFVDGRGVLKMEVSKQPGTGSDRLGYKVVAPVSYLLPGSVLAGERVREMVFSGDLSSDRIFKTDIQKIK